MKLAALLFSTILSLGTQSSASEAGGPVAMPDTVAGRRAAAYFTAFNSGSVEKMRVFLLDNIAEASLAVRSVEARLQTFQTLRGETGDLTPVRVLQSDSRNLVVLVKSVNGGWLEYTFELEEQPPQKLRSIRLEESTEEAASEPRTPITETEMLALVRPHLAQLDKADQFSGTVLIAKDFKPIFTQAYGMASKEYAVPNRTDTKFNLGSINKRVTKIAIYQLVEKGVVSLDDTIGRRLPDYPNKDAAAKVKVSHLLEMTSGIGDFFGDRYLATPKDKLRTIADYLPLFASDPLLFEPGSQNRYSNGGYVVLGAIIEKASGQSYYDYVREHIFKPAGMENTDSYESDVPVQNLASGYTRRWDANEHPTEPRRNNILTRPARGSSAGGGYSTAEDLLRFAQAMLGNKLLSPAYTQLLFTGHLPSQGEALTPARDFPAVVIAGGAPGMNAALDCDPPGGYTVIVMSNYDPPAAESVARRVRRWLDRIPMPEK